MLSFQADFGPYVASQVVMHFDASCFAPSGKPHLPCAAPVDREGYSRYSVSEAEGRNG